MRHSRRVFTRGYLHYCVRLSIENALLRRGLRRAGADSRVTKGDLEENLRAELRLEIPETVGSLLIARGAPEVHVLTDPAFYPKLDLTEVPASGDRVPRAVHDRPEALRVVVPVHRQVGLHCGAGGVVHEEVIRRETESRPDVSGAGPLHERPGGALKVIASPDSHPDPLAFEPEPRGVLVAFLPLPVPEPERVPAFKRHREAMRVIGFLHFVVGAVHRILVPLVLHPRVDIGAGAGRFRIHPGAVETDGVSVRLPLRLVIHD